MLSREVRLLLGKEWGQLKSSRMAMATAFLLPGILLLFVPMAQILAVHRLGTQALAVTQVVGVEHAPAGIREMLQGNSQTFVRGMLPLLVSLGGLVVPAIMGAYTLITEREQKTLELLAALPIRVGQILQAKLLITLLVSSVVTLGMLSINGVLLLVLGIGDAVYVLSLMVLLVSALAYSTSSALLTALLARDFRTANNITGAMLGPTVGLTLGLTAYLPGQTVRILATAALYLVGAILCSGTAVRVVTFERLLR